MRNMQKFVRRIVDSAVQTCGGKRTIWGVHLRLLL
nr:MAG TPA: hypothetical protein [Caudoviricetes sp.]